MNKGLPEMSTICVVSVMNMLLVVIPMSFVEHPSFVKASEELIEIEMHTTESGPFRTIIRRIIYRPKSAT